MFICLYVAVGKVVLKSKKKKKKNEHSKFDHFKKCNELINQILLRGKIQIIFYLMHKLELVKFIFITLLK